MELKQKVLLSRQIGVVGTNGKHNKENTEAVFLF